tara:strand:- start:630 stop:830 length:201 start_codon:yes stop_codon:yes gene_type:complete
LRARGSRRQRGGADAARCCFDAALLLPASVSEALPLLPRLQAQLVEELAMASEQAAQQRGRDPREE